MGIKDIWNRLIGREAEIDYSVPMTAYVPQPVMRRTTNCWTHDIEVMRADTGETIILTPGCYIDTPINVRVTVSKVKPAKAKPRALKKLTAHGTASSKSKRRSSKKKKPSTRKRGRK